MMAGDCTGCVQQREEVAFRRGSFLRCGRILRIRYQAEIMSRITNKESAKLDVNQ